MGHSKNSQRYLGSSEHIYFPKISKSTTRNNTVNSSQQCNELFSTSSDNLVEKLGTIK